LVGVWGGIGAAGLFLTVPVISSYGVGFFDDPVMVAGVNAAVFYAACWGRRPSVAAASMACVSLGVATAVKLPALYALLPMSVAAITFSARGVRGLLHRHLLWAVPLALFLSLSWYVVLSWRAAHWPNVHMLLDLRPGSGKFGDFSSMADPGNWVLLSKRVTQEVAGYSGLVLAALGVACLPRDRRALIPLAWCVAVGVYVLLVFRGHLGHDYYQMAFAAPLALLCASPLAVLSAKRADADAPRAPSRRLPAWAPAALGGLLALGMIVELHPFRHFLRTWTDERWEPFAADVAAHSGEDALVLVIDHSQPEVFYLADRRGYHLNASEADPEAIQEKLDRGVVAVGVLEPDRLWQSGHEGFAELVARWPLAARGDHHAVFVPPSAAPPIEAVIPP